MAAIVVIPLIVVGIFCFLKHKVKKRKKRIRLHSERARLLELLEKNWQNSLSAKGVNGLGMMPEEWKSAIIPKKSVQGAELNERLVTFAEQIRHTAPGKRSELRNQFQQFIAQEVAPFFASRVEMYTSLLAPHAKSAPTTEVDENCVWTPNTSPLFRQIMSLLYDLDNMFKRSYQQRFDLRVVGEMGKWNQWALYQTPMPLGVGLEQSTSDLFRLYLEAEKVHSSYNAFFKRLAKQTGADWVPSSLKKIFRILEKAVLQKAEKAEEARILEQEGGPANADSVDSAADSGADSGAEDFDCSKVFDIVRGTLVYATLAEGPNNLLGGVRAIYACKEFQVLRLKDRFNKPTSACWRDVLLNGRMVDGDGTVQSHIVEVQLHHRDLRRERLNVAGHVIYERHRALLEACELACGSQATQNMLSKIHHAMIARSKSLNSSLRCLNVSAGDPESEDPDAENWRQFGS